QRYLYDEAGQWLGEYDGQGQAKQQVIWLENYPIAVIDGSGAAANIGYIEPDHLGTPRVIIDAKRNVATWRWPLTGEAFGADASEEAPDGDGERYEFDLRFPGQRYDRHTGLYYNYFRDYEPQTGRYVQSDPVGLKGGLNTYAYVGGNPVMGVDPLGLQAMAPVAGWIGTDTAIPDPSDAA
ncbi:RHS repeat-associated core domain-containing protein, partial [Lysobacter pythonis]